MGLVKTKSAANVAAPVRNKNIFMLSPSWIKKNRE